MKGGGPAVARLVRGSTYPLDALIALAVALRDRAQAVIVAYETGLIRPG